MMNHLLSFGWHKAATTKDERGVIISLSYTDLYILHLRIAFYFSMDSPYEITRRIFPHKINVNNC